MVTVTSDMQGTTQVIHITGRVDGFSAPLLENELQTAIKNKHYKLIADLSATEFLSSAGMRALLHARQQVQDKHGDLKLAGLSENTTAALKLVGLDKLFKIYDTATQALADS